MRVIGVPRRRTIVSIKMGEERILDDKGPPTGAPIASQTRVDVPAATLASATDPGYSPALAPRAIDPASLIVMAGLGETAFFERYEQKDELGKGGMGEVLLYADRRIGREVAVKMMRADRSSRADLLGRFVCEARVQGQLEHPAIVPVYDLGTMPDGTAYFAMRRIRGYTLEQILGGLRRGDDDAIREFSRRRLLGAFASVCLAVDFAHARGVVHRDLKPGNIMLGHFGEVYILDWGVAKIMNADEAIPESDRIEASAPTSMVTTGAGAVLGTPGYMAPEQATRDPIDARADVYALGAILFEILTREPLHGRGDLTSVLASTVAGRVRLPSHAAPGVDIAPELDAICRRATARDPEDRFESARALNDALQRYLDGDRDIRRRRQLASEHADRARDLASSVLVPLEPTIDATTENERRAEAIREVGRALALDPDNDDALHTMVGLLATAPRELPPEARAEIEASRRAAARRGSMIGTIVYALFFVCFVAFYGLPIIDWPLMMAVHGCILTAFVLSFVHWRRLVMSDLAPFGAFVASSVGIALCTRIVGLFVVLPALALANVVATSMKLRFSRRLRRSVLTIGMLSVLGPYALETVGILAPTLVLEHGHLAIQSYAVRFEHPALLLAFFALVSTVAIIAGATAMRNVRTSFERQEEQIVSQAWHFRQLAPPRTHASGPVRRHRAAATPPLAGEATPGPREIRADVTVDTGNE